MPIKFAVKIVRLKVYMTIAISMALTLMQGHSGSAKNQHRMLLATKQARSI